MDAERWKEFEKLDREAYGYIVRDGYKGTYEDWQYVKMFSCMLKHNFLHAFQDRIYAGDTEGLFDVKAVVDYIWKNQEVH